MEIRIIAVGLLMTAAFAQQAMAASIHHTEATPQTISVTDNGKLLVQ